MDSPVDSHSSERKKAPPSNWFLNPYMQIALGALLVTASELLLWRGAQLVVQPTGMAKWLGINALASGWTWMGIITYVLSFICWIYVLRYVPLSIAFPAINIVHVLVPVGSWLFLHDHISPMRWGGIAMVLMGILLIVGPVARAEERL